YLEQRSEVGGQRSDEQARPESSDNIENGGEGSINIPRLRRSSEQLSSFEEFESILKELYADYTFDFAAKESGVDANSIEAIAKLVATAGTQLSTHNWRSASSGNSGGWQVARCLFILNAVMGA